MAPEKKTESKPAVKSASNGPKALKEHAVTEKRETVNLGSPPTKADVRVEAGLAEKPDNRELRHQPDAPVSPTIDDTPNLGDLVAAVAEAKPVAVEAGEPVLDDGSQVFNFPNGDVVVIGPSGFKV